MNIHYTRILIIGLLSFGVTFAQEEKQAAKPAEESSVMDAAQVDSAQKPSPVVYDRALYVGVDAFAPVRGWFDRKNTGYQAAASFRVYRKLHLASEVGRSTIAYDRLGWKANLQGEYYKLGFNWSLYEYSADPDQMYYVGLRYAFSPYWQEIQAYPVRSIGAVHTGGSLQKIRLKGQWIEPVIGARVALFNTPIYLDASLSVKFLIASTKQEGMDPLAIPGFGENKDKKNLGIKWAIVYRIPIIKRRQ